MLRHFRRSVCVSVCVTGVLCIKTVKRFVEILSPPDSPVFEFFVTEGCWLIPTVSPLTGAPNTRGEKIGRFLTYKFVCLGNGATYGANSYRSWIGNHTQAIKWWHFQLPWVTPIPVSRSPNSSKANILQTVHAMAGNMTFLGFFSDSWGFLWNGGHPPTWIFKSWIFERLLRSRGPVCIIVPNFIKIGQTVLEISHLTFFKMAAVGHCGFVKIAIFEQTLQSGTSIYFTV